MNYNLEPINLAQAGVHGGRTLCLKPRGTVTHRGFPFRLHTAPACRRATRLAGQSFIRPEGVTRKGRKGELLISPLLPLGGLTFGAVRNQPNSPVKHDANRTRYRRDVRGILGGSITPQISRKGMSGHLRPNPWRSEFRTPSLSLPAVLCHPCTKTSRELGVSGQWPVGRGSFPAGYALTSGAGAGRSPTGSTCSG